MRSLSLLSALLLVAQSASVSLWAAAASSSTASCQPASFNALLGSQTIPGANVIDVQTHEHHDYESVAVHPSLFTARVTACEVKLVYENPGANSSQVTITTWLPLQREAWNGRFLGTGGGGFQCSMGPGTLNEPLTEGFATSASDGGLTGTYFAPDYTLIAPGQPDKFKLERLGHRAIHDMTVAAKQVVQLYYGVAPSTSYYRGCSTGGRQGLMEAAHYPDDYDGILVSAPAANINHFIPSVLAEAAFMFKHNVFPTPCEMAVIRDAAVARCDRLDGREDGVVARQDLCKFTAQSVVGQKYVDWCDGSDLGGVEKEVTEQAARLYQTIVGGSYTDDGRKISSGFPWGTNVTFPIGVGLTYVNQLGKRLPFVMPFARTLIDDYVEHGLKPGVVDQPITVEQIAEWQDRSARLYDGYWEPLDDLRPFHKRGGKLIWWHGEEDSVIPSSNSFIKLDKIRAATFPGKSYDDSLLALEDFVRFYIVPGAAHCDPLPYRAGKVAAIGVRALNQLVDWVERGQAPEELKTDRTSEKGLQSVCRWPSLPLWTDGGETLTCIPRATSLLGRLPRLLELPIRFLEELPKWLLLRTEKLPGEL